MIKAKLDPGDDEYFHAFNIHGQKAMVRGLHEWGAPMEHWSTRESAGFYILPDNMEAGECV